MPNSLNVKCISKFGIRIPGMIDAHVHHNSPNTYPLLLKYVHNPREVDDWNCVPSVEGYTRFIKSYTKEAGDKIVDFNTSMYYKNFIIPEILLSGRRILDIELEEKYEKLDPQIKEYLLKPRILLLLCKEKDGTITAVEAKELEKRQKELRKLSGKQWQLPKDIPSLIIAPTMDMEFAHRNGYEGIPMFEANNAIFQGWEHQIQETEEAVKSNPLRLLPLFSYDPRRYRRPSGYHPNKGYYSPGIYKDLHFPHNHLLGDNRTCKPWNAPFRCIVGNDNSNDDNKLWLGFSMNPQFGFRPLDELCPYLPMFYKECQEKQIPILAHCAPEGLVTHEAVSYLEFDRDEETIEKRVSELSQPIIFNENNWNGRLMEEIRLFGMYNTTINQGLIPASTMFAGKENVANSEEMNHFYKNYGHPQNWWQVLRRFPDLHLCLAGFGGNSEWKHESMRRWHGSNLESSPPLPPREWIRSMIMLASKYPNVYIDISGLDILDLEIRPRIEWMLDFIMHEDNGFGCLKDKLIFGSDWYHSCLPGLSNTIRNVNKTGYYEYCRNVREFISNIDTDLWKCISLINPWRFYGLTEDRIDKMCTSLNIENNSELKNKLIQISREVYGTEINTNRPNIIFPLLTKPWNDEHRGIFKPETYCWRAPSGATTTTTYLASRGSRGSSHQGRDLYGNTELRRLNSGSLNYRHDRNQIAPFEHEPATTIVAICDGRVVSIRNFYNETWQVTILHRLQNSNGDIEDFRILYGEVDPDSIKVFIGQEVMQGQEIAKIGELVLPDDRNNYETSICFNRNASTQRPQEYNGHIITNMLHIERLRRREGREREDPLVNLIEGYKNSFGRNVATFDIGVTCGLERRESCINQRHCWHVLSQFP